MPSRLGAAFASVVALVGSVARADAAEGEAALPVRLTFEAPAGCKGRDAFFAQLQARSSRIREAVVGETAPSMHIPLSLAIASPGWGFG
jgi:hypothetical protein